MPSPCGRFLLRGAASSAQHGQAARSQLREALSSGDVPGAVEALRLVSQRSDAETVMVPEEWLIRALHYVVRHHQPVVPEDAAARQDPPVSLRRKLLRGASDIWVAADAVLRRAEVLRRASTSSRARAAIPALQRLAEKIPEEIFRDILWLARRQRALHRGREWASLWQLRSSSDPVCARHVAALAAFDGDVRAALEVLQRLRETSGKPLRRNDFHPLLEHAAGAHDKSALLRIVDHLKRQRVWGRERLNSFHRRTPAWARAMRVACAAQDAAPTAVAVDDAPWEDGFTAAAHVAQVCLKQSHPFVEGAKAVLQDVEARLKQEIAWDLDRATAPDGTSPNSNSDEEEKGKGKRLWRKPRPHVSLAQEEPAPLAQSLAEEDGESESASQRLADSEDSVAIYDKWGTGLSLLEFSVLLTLHLRNRDPDASLATLRHLLRHVARESVAVTWTFASSSCPVEVIGHVQLTALCLAHADRWDAAMELCLRVEDRWGLPARATSPGSALARAAVDNGSLDDAYDLLATVAEGKPLELARSRAKRRAEEMGVDTARRVQLSDRLDRMHDRVVPRFRLAAQEGFARAAERQDWARMAKWLELCQQWGARPEVGSVVDAWVSSLIQRQQDVDAVELAREAGEWLGWVPSRASAVETVHRLLERGKIALAASFVEAFPVHELRDQRLPPPGLREASSWLQRVNRMPHAT